VATDGGYAHPEMLVDTDWLAQHLDDPTVRIVDCDILDAYRRAHIPGAVAISGAVATGDNYWKNPDDRVHVMTPEQFAERMSGLGIGDDTFVVAYDASRSHYAARLWWALTYYGHDKVAVLNGGWDKWVAEGRPVSLKEPQHPKAAFTPQVRPEALATIDDMKNAIDKPEVVIWDVRSQGEYEGSNPRFNRRAGHIPGAVHMEWLNTITNDELRTFKPADELIETFKNMGLTPEKEVLTH